jgi:zinc-binding in reverse transcriptase
MVRKNKILTKANLVKRGWQDNSNCMFCVLFEITDHFFVKCSYINYIWQWISQYNNFIFQGITLDIYDY